VLRRRLGRRRLIRYRIVGARAEFAARRPPQHPKRIAAAASKWWKGADRVHYRSCRVNLREVSLPEQQRVNYEIQALCLDEA
jgi:hypothetical protein